MEIDIKIVDKKAHTKNFFEHVICIGLRLIFKGYFPLCLIDPVLKRCKPLKVFKLLEIFYCNCKKVFEQLSQYSSLLPNFGSYCQGNQNLFKLLFKQF